MLSLLLAVIYLAFISLGLPDSLLGASWPVMYQGFGVPVSYAGAISMIIAVGTIISSLLSDRLTRKLGAGKVTALSVATTALALWGFSVSGSFWMLCLWALPYGLGAGSVDAALNNYVALHYASRHMSWLHCMWGVGASIGPFIMGRALTGGFGWNAGYRWVSLMQFALTLLLVLSLPLWKNRAANNSNGAADDIPSNIHNDGAPLRLSQILALPGAKAVMGAFFCYCALESTTGLWASSYLVLQRGLAPETAAACASLYYLGITAGRFLSGFLTMRFNDTTMIRIGQSVVAVGLVALLLPLGALSAQIGLLVIGFGCAPIYPSVIHSTPARFGANLSQAVIGAQMASAYVGSCLMPPVFGLIANYITPALYPVYLLALLVCMFLLHETLVRSRP